MAKDVIPRVILNTSLPVTATKQGRQMLVTLHLAVLYGCLTEGSEIAAAKCTKGVPADARFVRSVFREWMVALIFEHESFAEVCVGSPIPIFELEFETI